jgi:hypothetical protein
MLTLILLITTIAVSVTSLWLLIAPRVVLSFDSLFFKFFGQNLGWSGGTIF